MPHPSSGSDWIEIFNPTSSNLDLAGWNLVDSTSTMKALSGSISPGSFVTFDVSNRLNNSGDSVYLKDANGSTIDNYSYSSDPGIDKSIGRSPDGSNWIILASTSKGSTNGDLTTPTPSPTPSATQSSTPNTSAISSFAVSNIPSQINVDQSFKVFASLSLPNNPDSFYYLKGAFKKTAGSNYFGKTLTGSSWVKNSSTFSDQYKITTDSSGNWSGNLEVQPDSDDSGFAGTGDYIFKVARYSSSGSGPTWSNEAAIKIISTESNSQGSAITESTSTSIDSLTTDQQSPSPVIRKSASIVRINIPKQLAYQIASIAAASSESVVASTTPQSIIKQEKRINFPIIVGTFLLLSGLSSLFYIYLQRKKEI